MKENKLEGTIVVIMSIFIIAIIAFTIYKVADSTKNLRVNEFNNINSNNQNTNNQDVANNPSESTQNSEGGTNNANTPTEDIPKKEEEVLLSTFSTNIYDNDTNRVDNIALAISKINNVIVEKDAVFSFNGTVGPMDFDHGFKESTAFDSNGNKIKVPGGGMCQISSTMYNAALEAKLEIVERHPHSRRVEYVPVDRDATIYYDTLDFKFKNTSGYPIKITASSDQYNVTINFYSIK